MEAFEAVVRGIDHSERDRVVSVHLTREGARKALNDTNRLGKEVPEWTSSTNVEAYLYGYVRRIEIKP